MKRLALILALVLAACDTTTEPSDPNTGSYDMVIYSGHALPYTGGRVTMYGATLEIRNDGTYSLSYVMSGFGSAQFPTTESGTWSASYGTINLVRTAMDTNPDAQPYPWSCSSSDHLVCSWGNGSEWWRH